MKLNEEQTKHIATLAKIHLPADKIDRIGEDMGNILAMVHSLQEVDCHNIEPLAHPLENVVPYAREDIVTETDQRDLLQQNAPSATSGLYLVPQVIE